MDARTRLHTISALVVVLSLALLAVAPAAGAAAPVVRCFGRPSTILGGPADDQGVNALRGSPRADVISALEDKDQVFAGASNDFACGNAGDDELNGEGGADFLAGDTGNDRLEGGPRNDNHFGGPGLDSIFMVRQGDQGADQAQGGPDDDFLYAIDGVGNDTLDGGESPNDNDVCFVDVGDIVRNCESINPD